MSAQNTPQSNDPKPPPAPARGPEKLSDDLLAKLHEANQGFSNARHEREEAIDAASTENTGREKAGRDMIEAEKRVESVAEEIERDLNQL